MHGEAIPYLIQTDWMVTSLMLLSFMAISWSVRNGKSYLKSHFRNFFTQKKRESIFEKTTNVGIQYLFFLGIVSCVMGGLYIYGYTMTTQPEIAEHIAPYGLLLIYVGSVIGLALAKWLGYTFVNWIFFDKEKTTEWTVAYFDLIIFMSLVLFPALLVMVYFDINLQGSQLIMLFVLLLYKILLLFKCFRNFYIRVYGLLHIILYFCALEILPDLLLANWVNYLNNFLIIKF